MPDYRQTTNSAILVETKDDVTNALHTVIERPGGGFDYYRYDRGNLQWSGPYTSAGSAGNVHGLAIVSCTNNELEVLGREVDAVTERDSSADAGRLFQTKSASVRENTAFPWGKERVKGLGDNVTGAPGVCRWNGGNLGLDMLVPQKAGLAHWYRAQGGGSWSKERELDTTTNYTSAAMVIGSGKVLAAIGVSDNGALWLHRRDSGNQWGERALVGENVTSNVTLVETNRIAGVKYEMVVAEPTGKLGHYTFDADFNRTTVVMWGVAGRRYKRIGLVYNYAGQLELVAQANGLPFEHYLFDGKQWNEQYKPLPLLVNGSWNVKYDTKVIGIHASLFHDDQVLLFGMKDDDEGKADGSIFDTKKEEIKKLEGSEPPHVFCSGHAFLPNGDLLVAGGHTGHEHMLHVFERATKTWNMKPRLHGGRWYPTCTTLPDGKVLIIAGNNGAGKKGNVWLNNSYEIFDPTSPDAARKTVDIGEKIRPEWFCMDQERIDMYPFVFVLPHGKLFVHSRNTTRFFTYDPKTGDGAWSSRIVGGPYVRTYPGQGTAVLLPLLPGAAGDYKSASIVIFGGANGEIDTPALDSIETMDIDADGNTNGWYYGSKLSRGRVMADSVLLPDGNVLILNGSRSGKGDGCNSHQPELSVELYDSRQRTFTQLSPMRTPRLYHAAAILLPDATILVTGKDKIFNISPYDYPEHRGEILTPPYLLSAAPRPEITNAPAKLSAGEWFDIELKTLPPARSGR